MTTCTGMAFFPANFMLQTPIDDDNHQPPLSSPIPRRLPQEFHVAPLLGKGLLPFSAIDACEESNNNGGEEDLSDDGSQAGEKKRRLNTEQVKTLEKYFELGNKLEPERKSQLAKALGLQPRQIAIWFQNRRARWKTKQLEKDYEILKREFEFLKADNKALQSQNQKLQTQILALQSRESTESINLNKETNGSCNNVSENSSEVKLDISRKPTTIGSPLSAPPTSRTLLLPSSSSSVRPSAHHHHHHHQMAAQLFQSQARSDLQRHNFDHPIKEDSFSNILCGMEDQSGFWPWLDQQNFN
ncbi:hypothetical protein Nepgr_027990 [Nepenthes gracilis]|uniref:Homeobox-leucine zipper protein n=1 Tax=Nepenthes gracilis TaxID=150966 RepID=A0AAD3TCS0_NEPGR|nr:hypothetical protein Nepgr_027990 [Nepenthes gracilis]